MPTPPEPVVIDAEFEEIEPTAAQRVAAAGRAAAADLRRRGLPDAAHRAESVSVVADAAHTVVGAVQDLGRTLQRRGWLTFQKRPPLGPRKAKPEVR